MIESPSSWQALGFVSEAFIKAAEFLIFALFHVNGVDSFVDFTLQPT